MQNRELAGEFKKGLPDPLYYLWSTEGIFLEEALNGVTETVIASAPADFNYDVFYPSAAPLDILNAVSTLPFMSPRRLVVLKDFHQFPASAVKALAPYMKEPADTTCLVIFSQKAPAAAADIRCKVFPLNIQERDLPAWLKAAAAKRGIKLTDEAVECLVDYIGFDAGLLMMEIEKLSSSGKGTITGDDIISSASMMREFTTFELVDALVAGDSTRAFRILKSMFSSMSSYELPVIMGTLNWHYKQFYTLWLNKGRRPVKMREKTYRSLMKYLPVFTEEDFLGIFRYLHEADLGLKTSGRPELVLEVLLVRLLQKRSMN